MEEGQKVGEPTEKLPSHHRKLEYCFTRKPYRKGRRNTAVKVFTVNTESQYLIVNNVHATGLHKDVVKLFSKYGNVTQCEVLKDYPKEKFKDVFLVKFQHIQSARIAKRRTDEMYFYGSMLHVHYAPEFETPDDTRAKLTQRRAAVVERVRSLKKEENKLRFKDCYVKASPQYPLGNANNSEAEISCKKIEEGTFAKLQSSITLKTTCVPGGKSTESNSCVASTSVHASSITTAIRTQKEQIKKTVMERMKPVFNRTSRYISPHDGSNSGENCHSSVGPSYYCTDFKSGGTTRKDYIYQKQESTAIGPAIVGSGVKKPEARKRNLDISNGIVPRHKRMKSL